MNHRSQGSDKKPDVALVQEELVSAVKQGDEALARKRVFQLGTGPRQVRALLEAMLEEPAALMRQAAVFGLGELGGTASVRRLEQQLALEEARRDYDGAAVVEDITRALGRIEETGARALECCPREEQEQPAGAAGEAGYPGRVERRPWRALTGTPRGAPVPWPPRASAG
jgi:hypothetical protein